MKDKLTAEGFYKYLYGEDAPKNFQNSSSIHIFGFASAYHEYLTQQEQQEKERFKKPNDNSYVSIALLFNDGKVEHEVLTNMVGMCEFIVDRLYENGDISKPTLKEQNG